MGVQHKKDLCENGKDLWASVKRLLCIWFCTWETSISLLVMLGREGIQASYFQQGFICYYDEQGSLLGEIGIVNQEHTVESRSEATLSTCGHVRCWVGGCKLESVMFHTRGVFKIWDFDLVCLKIRAILQNLDQAVISNFFILQCRFLHLGPYLNLSHTPGNNPWWSW